MWKQLKIHHLQNWRVCWAFLYKGDIKPFKGINKTSLYEHGYVKHDKEIKEIDQGTHYLH